MWWWCGGGGGFKKILSKTWDEGGPSGLTDTTHHTINSKARI